MIKNGYPSDVSDEEWAFAAPYLTLMKEDAPQRNHSLRMMPNDLPPWPAVYQQTKRWLAAGIFESMVHDLRALLRLAEGRKAA